MAVREVFVRLYEEGHIYRGSRIINWCPRCETALAEIEVEYSDDAGEMVHIFYPFSDGTEGGVTVATTRAETMLGDTGVAVHPDDDRYAAMVGERCGSHSSTGTFRSWPTMPSIPSSGPAR